MIMERERQLEQMRMDEAARFISLIARRTGHIPVTESNMGHIDRDIMNAGNG